MDLEEYYRQVVSDFAIHQLRCKRCTPDISIEGGFVLCEIAKHLKSTKESVEAAIQRHRKAASDFEKVKQDWRIQLYERMDREKRGRAPAFGESSVEDARRVLRKFNEAYPYVKSWSRKTQQEANMRSWEIALPPWRIPALLPKGWRLLYYTISSNTLIVTAYPQGKSTGTKVVSVELQYCPVTGDEARRDWVMSLLDVKLLWECGQPVAYTRSNS